MPATTPIEAIAVRRAITTSTSIKVKPFLSRIEVLGNFIDRSDDGYRDKADQQAHADHHDRFDDRREAFGLLVQILFVHIGEVQERIRQVARALADFDHLGEYVREKFCIFLEVFGEIASFGDGAMQTVDLFLVREICRSICRYDCRFKYVDAAFDENSQRPAHIYQMIIFEERA